jgi:hypothetical protein
MDILEFTEIEFAIENDKIVNAIAKRYLLSYLNIKNRILIYLMML